MKNKGFTLIEVLFVMVLLSFVLILSFNLLKLNSSYVYKGAKGYIDRVNYVDLLYNLTKEIQSSDELNISSDGKRLVLTRRGDVDEHIYEITDNYLAYDGENILNIKGDGSKFEKVVLKYPITGGMEQEELENSVGVTLIIQRSTRGDKTKDVRLSTAINVRSMKGVNYDE